MGSFIWSPIIYNSNKQAMRTIKEIAEDKGVTTQTVRNMIKDGRINKDEVKVKQKASIYTPKKGYNEDLTSLKPGEFYGINKAMEVTGLSRYKIEQAVKFNVLKEVFIGGVKMYQL